MADELGEVLRPVDREASQDDGAVEDEQTVHDLSAAGEPGHRGIGVRGKVPRHRLDEERRVARERGRRTDTWTELGQEGQAVGHIHASGWTHTVNR